MLGALTILMSSQVCGLGLPGLSPRDDDLLKLTKMDILTQELQVTKDHLDFNDHVNNLVYLQWALDISRKHWLSKISKEIDQKYFWMVRSHHVEYKKQAFLGDQVLVKTYVEGYRGPFSNRVVKIHKNEDLLVVVKSNWCLIERATQKLKRVPEEIKVLFQ